MAESLILGLTKSAIEKAGSYIAGEIQLAWNHKKELGKLKSSLVAISAVLQDAEQKQRANDSIRVWLQDLKDAVYQIEDLLDDVATDVLRKKISRGLLRKVSYYASHVIFLFHSSQKIRSIKERLDDVAARKSNFNLIEHPLPMGAENFHQTKTYSFVNEAEIIGREEAKREIVECVLRISNESSCGLSVVPIVGLGGIGKTALAKLVYNDQQIAENFDMKLWACDLEKFDLKRVIEDIIESATGESKLNLQLERLQIKLRNILQDKKYLLVLDNVWNDDINKWTELRDLLAGGAAKGSAVLVTTRMAQVAQMMGPTTAYDLKDLSFEVCWRMFSRCVFKQGEEQRYPLLVEIGESIVRKCGGVPLAVKTLGSLLCGERDEAAWRWISESELWKIYPKDEGILAALKLSYYRLPFHVRRCFVYCSFFAKGTLVERMDFICLWMAQGLLVQHPSYGVQQLEDIGNRYFQELVSRSFFQDLEFNYDGSIEKCKVHDLLHDLAASIAGEEQATLHCAKQHVENPERLRHIAWDDENLSEKEFPREKLMNARGVRSFTFLYWMDHKISKSFLEGLISSFKHVRVLDLNSSQFEELPSSIGELKHLRYLDLAWNESIKALPKSICKLLNLQMLNLNGCKSFGELPRDIGKLASLRHLCLTSTKMTVLPESGLKGWTYLQGLYLVDCKELMSLSEESMGHLTTLRYLNISNCPKVASLPNNMKFLTCLKKLDILNCSELDLMRGEGMNGLKRLESLEIKGLPKFEELPEGFRYASCASLRHLFIEDCQGLRKLPECLQYFTHLQKLILGECPNLSAMPQWFPSVKSLHKLDVYDCPHLSRSCAKGSDHDWPLISHIPHISLNRQCIQDLQPPPTAEI